LGKELETQAKRQIPRTSYRRHEHLRMGQRRYQGSRSIQANRHREE
jgi:hypothetical protein